MTLLDHFENPHFSAAAQLGSDGTSPFTLHLDLPDVFNCSAAKLKEKEDPSTPQHSYTNSGSLQVAVTLMQKRSGKKAIQMKPINYVC